MTTLKYMGRDVVQITGMEWCEPDDYSNSYWDISSRRTYEPISIRVPPIKKMGISYSRNPRDICYRKYKEDERRATEAANKGDMMESYRYFSSAATGRKKFWERFHGNVTDEGHYAKKECIDGAAWIQRECYENEKMADQIANEYDRKNSKPRRYNSFWARKDMDIRAKNGNYFKHSMNIHKNINKN